MDANDGEKNNRKYSKTNWNENIAMAVAEIVDKLISIEKSKKSINFNQLLCGITTKYRTDNRPILVDIIDAIPPIYVNIKLALLKTLYCDYLSTHPFSDDHPHNNNRFFNENSRIYRYYQPAKYRQKYQCCTSSMGEADEKVPEQSDFVRPFNGLCSPEFHVFMEFIFEQLKSSVEVADCKSMSRMEFQEFDFRLRSFFRCFKGLSLAKNQRKIILRIFEIIELLDDMKRNCSTETDSKKLEQKFISESTISALTQVAGSFVLCNPKAIYLAKFFQLCYRGPLMTKLVLKTLHSIMENCYFEPGETLIFPQRELPTEMSFTEEVVFACHKNLYHDEDYVAVEWKFIFIDVWHLYQIRDGRPNRPVSIFSVKRLNKMGIESKIVIFHESTEPNSYWLHFDTRQRALEFTLCALRVVRVNMCKRGRIPIQDSDFDDTNDHEEHWTFDLEVLADENKYPFKEIINLNSTKGLPAALQSNTSDISAFRIYISAIRTRNRFSESSIHSNKC